MNNKIFGKVVGGDSTNHTITIQCEVKYLSMLNELQMGSYAEVIINPTYNDTVNHIRNMFFQKLNEDI